MPRLLTIGPEVWLKDGHPSDLLSGQKDWEIVRFSWNALTTPAIRKAAPQLIVAVALDETARACEFFRWLRANPLDSQTLAVLPATVDFEDLQVTLNAVDDFVLWPAPEDEMRYRIGRMVGGGDCTGDTAKLLKADSDDGLGLAQLVGSDPCFQRVIRSIPQFARSDAPVLITGETGTGKEMCARAIHHVAKRRDLPWIPVDCAGIPQQLFENELFGHTRGAYTDARGDQKGLAAMAHGGSLFLDEIDALPLTVQTKLLRFLQDGVYRPLGSDQFVHSDVRVIAATNRDIESLVRAGQFRADLFYRLNVLRLELPPLRDRPSDIGRLAQYFLSGLCRANGLVKKTFSRCAIEKLASYEWPGNVRELHNVVRRAFVVSEDNNILPCHLAIPVSGTVEKRGERFRDARDRAIQAFERRYVEEMIRKHSGNVTRAAMEAGKERRSFGRLIRKYDLSRVNSDPPGGSQTTHP